MPDNYYFFVFKNWKIRTNTPKIVFNTLGYVVFECFIDLLCTYQWLLQNENELKSKKKTEDLNYSILHSNSWRGTSTIRIIFYTWPRYERENIKCGTAVTGYLFDDNFFFFFYVLIMQLKMITHYKRIVNKINSNCTKRRPQIFFMKKK